MNVNRDFHAVIGCGLLGSALVLSAFPSAAPAQDAPDFIELTGVVRDFSFTHPDFSVAPAEGYGHYVGSVAHMLGPDGRPVFTGNGQEVIEEWYDDEGHPIMPYAGPGLPFGHFDVDVYDEPTTNELYHKHKFDDAYDVTYIDVANDTKLLFDSIVGSAYPNNLRLEFLNAHNGGGGTYTFEAGDGVQTGNTEDGFTATFDPASLSQLQVNFVALAFMRATQPNESQGDAVDRDDAFAIRMYDVTTDELVYEIAVYHHFKEGEEPEQPPGGVDACGEPINDSAGSYGNPGNSGITDAESFDQWFRDVPGVNLSGFHAITLMNDGAGVYEYLTDDFHPIDGALLGNEGELNNHNLTYAVTGRFTYELCAGQFIEFRGTDDAWLFINGSMVMDLGGIWANIEQYVDLDRLGLSDGQTYQFQFFYAQRQPVLSVFRLRTNLPMETELPTISAAFD